MASGTRRLREELLFNRLVIVRRRFGFALVVHRLLLGFALSNHAGEHALRHSRESQRQDARTLPWARRGFELFQVECVVLGLRDIDDFDIQLGMI